MFDVYLRVWREVYPAGALSRLYGEILPDGSLQPYTASEVPVDSGGFAGPGKRWRHSMVVGPQYEEDCVLKQDMAIFGGHR